jgi:hypothetical protein
MSDIPVHVQRSFEQRWPLNLPHRVAAPKSLDLKGTVNSLPRVITAKETNVTNWPGRSFHFRRAGTAPELPRGTHRAAPHEARRPSLASYRLGRRA